MTGLAHRMVGMLAGGLLLGGFVVLVVWPASGQEPNNAEAQAAVDLFRQQVGPLLAQKCVVCHGADPKDIRGQLDLRTRGGALRGGESNQPALVPGKPNQSRLYLAVTWQDEALRMPPKENDRLAASDVEAIRKWIAGGAPWPDTSNGQAQRPVWDEGSGPAGGLVVKTSGGLSPDWDNRRYVPQDIWAYLPLQRPEIPAPAIPPEGEPTAAPHPIDAFLRSRQVELGIAAPSPRADRLTLLRRATLDLTGLPPTCAEIEAFLQDRSPQAFEHVVARLLASPHYGEQQARHWLDVVRYADTSGFSNDFERPHAWRYRDYVIRAFNADKPYDRFIVEQIAGDELDPTNPEFLIAAGFLRAGPWEHTAMTVAALTRQRFLDDVTHHVGVVFLGQGLRCAACHDHKFDPVPTRDYYRLQACFATTHLAEREARFLPEEHLPGAAAARGVIVRRLNETKAVLDTIRRRNEAAVAELVKQVGVARPEELPRDDFARRDNLGLSKYEISLRKIYQKRVDYFERELQRFEPYAFSVYSGPSNNYLSPRLRNPVPASRDGPLPEVHILSGGALESPLQAVTPGVLSALAGLHGTAQGSTEPEVAIPQQLEGRRLALARWIASKHNPLTARVIVNRVWQQHFGQGIVATPNNFGRMGARPTHPLLLDWLAWWFMESGWSLKKLHALIMSSAAYQQSGQHPEMERLQQLDPQNKLLAYFPLRRLAAEELRDGMLAASGELNFEMGGPGVFPEINWEVALQPRHIMGSVAPAYQPSPTPAERNRRTIYCFRYRTLPDPLLEAFNRPGSEISCERRDDTTIAPQALAMFNSQFVHQRAIALAAAVQSESPDRRQQIEAMFERVYGRSPIAGEMQACLEHVLRMEEHHRKNPPQGVPLPTKVERHMVEEMTGEDIHWEEELDILQNYRRDLMPWDVPAETRALAELGLVLFNSNEFLYLR